MSDTESSAVEFDREKVYPVLPLRDIVVFPSMIVPLFVGREKSVRALEEVMREDKHILVVTQKNAQEDDPEPDGIYEIGTIASVLQLLKLPGSSLNQHDINKVVFCPCRRGDFPRLAIANFSKAEAGRLDQIGNCPTAKHEQCSVNRLASRTIE